MRQTKVGGYKPAVTDNWCQMRRALLIKRLAITISRLANIIQSSQPTKPSSALVTSMLKLTGLAAELACGMLTPSIVDFSVTAVCGCHR